MIRSNQLLEPLPFRNGRKASPACRVLIIIIHLPPRPFCFFSNFIVCIGQINHGTRSLAVMLVLELPTAGSRFHYDFLDPCQLYLPLKTWKGYKFSSQLFISFHIGKRKRKNGGKSQGPKTLKLVVGLLSET